MTGAALRDRWGRFIALVNSVDGIILLVGFVGVLVGWAVESLVVRLVCFSVAGVSAIAGVVSVRAKSEELRRGLSIASSPSVSREEGNDMKKLLFDDFQSDSQSKYQIKEVKEEDQFVVRTAAAQPSSAPTPWPSMRRFTPQQSQPRPHSSEAKPITHEFQISDFFDVESHVFKGKPTNGGQIELRTEFDFLLSKVLAAIKEVVFAHTVAFFWANHEKQHLICEAVVSDSESLVKERRFAMGHDVISQIARNGKPELISRVNPVSERELLIYYAEPEFVKSFIGVPVFYPGGSTDRSIHEAVAVIAIDSKVEDAFGPETISLLGQFTKLASALIKTSTDKYDLVTDVELLNAIRRFQERIRNDMSVATVTQMLAEESAKLLNWSFLSVVLNDEEHHTWLAKRVVNRSNEAYIAVDQQIDLSGCLVGGVIQNNLHQLVGDIGAQPLPRYFQGEKLENKGSFLSVPISSLNKCYGALSVESREKFNFSHKDIEILYRLAENAASALEILFMYEIIREYVIVDELTGTYSKKFFLRTMEQELARADDYGSDLSLILLTVDNAAGITQRYGQVGFEHVLVTLAKVLRSSVRPYDAIGRYDYNRFGVLLANTAANDAYLWAEKIRKSIASHIMTVDEKSFSVTVSIGVAGALEGMKKEEIFDNASAVLRKGIEGGGNTVRVF